MTLVKKEVAAANALSFLSLGGISASSFASPVAITATADGTTTGVIPATAEVIEITCDTAAKWVTLPSPVVGKVIVGWVTANGCEVRTSAPATIGINGGAGANYEMALAALTPFIAICVSATNWVILKFAALEVAAA